MDLFDFSFAAGQVCAGLYLLYGGYLCLYQCVLRPLASVADGLSPKRSRYSIEKRPA
jgi:hypothetical protein